MRWLPDSLTLSSHPPWHRVKILKEKALPEIEQYMFEDHDHIRQAATECMCNLVTCKEVRGHPSLLRTLSSHTVCVCDKLVTQCNIIVVCVFQVQDRYLEDGNDRLKLLVLMCAEDDEKLQRAAAGALAMLTAAQKKLCTKMTLVVCPSGCIHTSTLTLG